MIQLLFKTMKTFGLKSHFSSHKISKSISIAFSIFLYFYHLFCRLKIFV
uniref:Uncharacterized protein n=1 Tax=Heterorhabditis bacteriophora TaxID=37862 RepID=A0A1I7WHU3_HETBA